MKAILDTSITFAPKWDEDHDTCSQLLVQLGMSLVKANASNLADSDNHMLDDISEEFFREISVSVHSNRSQRIEAAGSILLDLVRQGWDIYVEKNVIKVSANKVMESVEAEKQRVRSLELIKRDEQLRTPTIRRFIEQMESSRLFGEEFVSIFSLMRDGRELSGQLTASRDDANFPQQLGRIIKPYIQVIDLDEEKCQFTGFNLSDIWRYFRYTWANQVNPIPGRSMRFLVRDGATLHHTVIGIGALGSPIVALSSRDKNIGWDFRTFLESCKSISYQELSRWIQKVMRDQLDETYVVDLLEEGILTEGDIEKPNKLLIESLKEHCQIAKNIHIEHGANQHYKKRLLTESDCEQRARQPLFRSKRCDRLADLLRIQQFLNRLSDLSDQDSYNELLNTKEGNWVITATIKTRKSNVIGIDVADITVCGAIPPYNGLVAGKLISALSASPQIISAYNRKYRNQVSEIASGMAGKLIVKEPGLALLGTTSLYGSTSSQYNRLKIPAALLGGDPDFSIHFRRVGKTNAFGSSQFSERTVSALEKVSSKRQNGSKVNNIFGEGVSPKMRKIRDGLTLLGISSDPFMKHSRHRAIYMIPLTKNYSQYLLGFEHEPEYIMTIDNEVVGSQKITQWWLDRWAVKRCNNQEVLDEIATHDFTYPIQHGARVKLPLPTFYQPSLLD